ncbi:hypothetical protein [Azospirillum largimobile]
MDMDLHRKRAKEAWQILVEAARRNTPLTYKQLSDAIGVHWRVASLYLGVIQKYSKTENIPPLQALAVNGTTGLPGNGYCGSSNNKKSHIAILMKVHHHKWDKAPPNFSHITL